MTTQSMRSWNEEVYRFVFFLVALLFSVFLNQGQLDGAVRDVFFSIHKPSFVLNTRLFHSTQNLQSGFVIVQNGGRHLAQIENDLLYLRARDSEFSMLVRENELLRQELGKIRTTQSKLFRFYGNGSEWFIDGGSQHGVQVGQNVRRDSALVGVVSDVYPHFSRVKTLLDKEWRVPVQVGSESARPRGMYDSGKGVSVVRYVPMSSQISEGQVIRTLGDGVLSPERLLGWVKSVEPASDHATWQIVVELAAPPSRVEWVEVELLQAAEGGV